MAGFVIQAGAVQDYLGKAISEALADSDESSVPCYVGFPSGGPDATHVRVMGDFSGRVQRYMSGGTERDEEAPITVRVLSTMNADDMPAVRDRVLALAEIVELAISSDTTLGGTVRFARVTAFRAEEGVDADGRRQFSIDLTVTYETTVSAA